MAIQTHPLVKSELQFRFEYALCSSPTFIRHFDFEKMDFRWGEFWDCRIAKYGKGYISDEVRNLYEAFLLGVNFMQQEKTDEQKAFELAIMSDFPPYKQVVDFRLNIHGEYADFYTKVAFHAYQVGKIDGSHTQG